MGNMSIRAVIFDLGGVVLGSPVRALREFERVKGLEPGIIGAVIKAGGSTGAWARLERGEIPYSSFIVALQIEFDHATVALSVAEMMGVVQSCLDPHPGMLAAIRSLRRHGYRLAALTNNWNPDPGPNAGVDRFADLEGEFDEFVQSYRVGYRKPETEIYAIACRALGIEPPEAVFLDDIGANLKAARRLGMTTIKVHDPDAALGELERALAPAWGLGRA